MKPHVSNVLAIYNMASAKNMRDGLSWYTDAHNLCTIMESSYGISVSTAAGIIAALSPMSKWDNNKNKAIQLCEQRGIVSIGDEGKNGIGIGANVVKAQSIYFGTAPLDTLGGNKVRAFYSTILNPNGDCVPVIDRHAFDIAVGAKTNDTARRVLDRKGVYESFANVYREAALIAGIGAAQMQAITWMEWRVMHGIVSE